MGNLLEQEKSADVRHNYIYAYAGTYPIAEVTNGDSVSIAYTSFEADGSGNWTIGAGTLDTNRSVTGRNSYNLTGGPISKTGLNSSTTYIVSCWSQNGAYSIRYHLRLSGYRQDGIV